MLADDIPVRLLDLPCTIGGFVVQSPDGETIVLNSRRSREENLKTYAHELAHIQRDDFSCTENVNRIETIVRDGER